MACETPPPEKLPEPGYYYHFKHDPDGPLNNYAYYIYGVGHHTEDDCRGEDAFMQVYRPLYEDPMLTGTAGFSTYAPFIGFSNRPTGKGIWCRGPPESPIPTSLRN
jgi:hypothetical protein